MRRDSCRAIPVFVLAAIMAACPVALFSAPAEEVSVSLITILPGRSLYSAFGHSALRIVNRQKGTDILYNYGLSVHPFDARFVLGMVTGHMDFMVAALDTKETFRFYSDVENRTIIEQVLNLSPDQTESLLSLLRHDVRPENQIYNYRYFSDNCATRVWDLLAPLCSPPGTENESPSRPSLRSQLHETLTDRAWLGTVIDLLLGPSTDRPQAPDAPLFLPKQLMDTAAVSGARGQSGDVPFVHNSSVVFQAEKKKPSALAITPLAVSLIVLVVSLASLLPSIRKKTLVYDCVLFAVAIVAGACILMFWLAAGYTEVGFNLNLLWANPLALIALLLSRRSPKSSLSTTFSVLAAALALLCAAAGGLGLQRIPVELRIVSLAIAIRCMSFIWTGKARKAETK